MEYGGYNPLEVVMLTLADLDKQNLYVYSLSIDRHTYEWIENALGSKLLRTKKGHIKIFAGYPKSRPVVLKRAMS